MPPYRTNPRARHTRPPLLTYGPAARLILMQANVEIVQPGSLGNQSAASSNHTPARRSSLGQLVPGRPRNQELHGLHRAPMFALSCETRCLPFHARPDVCPFMRDPMSVLQSGRLGLADIGGPGASGASRASAPGHPAYSRALDLADIEPRPREPRAASGRSGPPRRIGDGLARGAGRVRGAGRRATGRGRRPSGVGRGYRGYRLIQGVAW
jgi:hypothetical protein